MTLRIALIDDQTNEFTVNGQRCKVVPVEPTETMLCAAESSIVHGERDMYRAMLSAAALDLSSLPVVPERDKRVLGDNEREEGHTDGWNQALDAIGVRG